MPADPLAPILQHAAAGASRLDREKLEAISRTISRLDTAEFIEAAILAPGLEWDGDQPRPEGYLEIHGRQWWIDVTDADNRPHLLTVITAAALVDALHLQFSTAWVTRILPGVLAVQSVSFNGSGVQILAQVRSIPRLLPHLVDIVNPLDYAEFLDAIEGAGKTLPLPVGGTITFIVG